MCFSAAASFAGGAVLTSIGVASIRKNKEPSQRLFAVIPFLFGLQQVSEGFVWFALQSPGHDLILKLSTGIFLIAAVVIWPTLVPLAIVCMEKQRQRKNLLYVFLAVGAAVSISHLAGLMLYKVTVQISSYHILYVMDSPYLIGMIASIGYLIATILPLFVSSKRGSYLFGIIIVLAYVITQIFYQAYLVSVWCFFAAVASAVIWRIVREDYPIRSEDQLGKEPVG